MGPLVLRLSKYEREVLGDLDGTADTIISYAKVSRWVEDAPRRERARVEDSPGRAVGSPRRVRVFRTSYSKVSSRGTLSPFRPNANTLQNWGFVAAPYCNASRKRGLLQT